MHLSTARLTRSLLAVLAAGGLVAGCGEGEDENTPAKEAAATPVKFTIRATAEGEKKALEFPATIKTGLVEMTLVNTDEVPRSAQIVRVEGDHTVDDVLKVVNSDEAKIPDWIQDGGGLGAVKPNTSGTATQILAPGKYVIWDDEGGGEEDAPSHDELGAKGEFTVTGELGNAELPDQAARVTAIDTFEGEDREYDFEFDGLKAGRNEVRFENTGEELHHALFFPIAEGKTIKDVEAAFTAEEEPQGPPPVDFENGVGTAVIDGDIEQNIELDLEAGKYAVVCFISDRKGGKPHAAKGMLKELTIE